MARDNLLECFTCAYIDCALCADAPDEALGLNSDEIAPETLARMEADCASFWKANVLHILVEGAPRANQFDSAASESEQIAARAGYDFWLSRNGHGVGFWDGDWPEPHATLLDTSAQSTGSFELYSGDGGMIYAAP